MRNRNRSTFVPVILAALTLMLAAAAAPPLDAADLEIGSPVNEEPGTLVPPEGKALAFATDIRVSGTDATDLVTYIAEEIAELRAEVFPPAPAAFIGWSEDSTFAAAEFKAGTGVTGDRHGEVPDTTISGTFAYLGLWLAGDAWDGITSVRLDGALFDINAFADGSTALAIDGAAGKYRRTVARQSHALLSGETLRWE